MNYLSAATRQVVIIGNSAAGLSALEAFRQRDRSSSVQVISREGPFPYARVQIPYHLKDRVRLGNLYIREADYFNDLNAPMTCCRHCNCGFSRPH
ncbi:MAG: NAD(P)/FAD-dependent oxidoreductase [Gammaproteobacteria bacterium]|nr:NAD(P)/FAD-dependent oxidoreductase [Gammaproteobacteria bacterium]MCP4766917.1 NAD(P)/FAD-dependent oxidoreductase [Gammaproteobacteria bacterium]